MNITPILETPYERADVIFPGLPVLPHGTERHPIPGGGSRVVEIGKGDEISVVDHEGLQQGEIVFFTPDGNSDLGKLGVTGTGRPYGVASVLCNGSASGRKVETALGAAGFNLETAEAIKIFSEGSHAGDMVTFFAECDGLIIVAAPGGPMQPDASNPPTELFLYIRRANPGRKKGGHGLPDPLADPIEDININPGEARSYVVKKGEYIQIVDVQGRECSDFQAFSMRSLDKGLEREIDPTTTRTLMGSLYPKPGIFSKYWNVDQEPLVEIIRDTCGRHDTFGLACTARYYEELGYPGHVNCSANINRELARYNIHSRSGWPAINFFFNTILDESNAITMDEPWSRPGDYVLLKAMSDLVCVSTACPCDVDPANGWNPTEIHVRTYGATKNFSRSIGYRSSTEADMQETRQTAFHDRLSKHTRDFTEYNGYWLPNTYSNLGHIAEYWACREKAAIMDLSPLRKYEVVGPDSEKLLQYSLTRDIKKLSTGQIFYTAMCYEHGGMIDDGTIFRLGDNNFRWIGGNDTSGLWLREKAQKLGLNCWVRNSTDQLHNVAVQGPMSRKILGKVFWTAAAAPTINELGLFRFVTARLNDFDGRPVILGRTGYTGELGYEIFCHPNDASEVFDAVWEAGEPEGLTPFGLSALDMVRIEAGLIFAGREFDDQTDPFEAGIGFTVPLKSKSDDFIGRAALEERKSHPQRKLVGLEIEGGIVPSPGDCLRIGKAQVGQITSAVKSPILGKNIALARVSANHSELGMAIEVGQLDGFQKRLRAHIVPYPHFDPKRERVKGNYGP